MEMLKSTTIWESASRPLFVRSTWLEAEKTGRAGAHRHFILDYEPRQRRVHSKSAASIRRSKAHATLQHSQSYDFVGDLSTHNKGRLTEAPPRDLLLIAAAKVEPPATQQLFQQKYTIKTTPATTSLQDLQSTLSQANSHADERLAERVLNWLDLAGKRVDTQQTQPQTETQLEISEMVKRPKKSIAKPSATHGSTAVSVVAASSKTNTQRSANTQTQSIATQSSATATRARKQVRYASAVRTEQTPISNQTAHARPTDAVKHITIIFDREGVPVRFNRPVRNIDLCTLSTSPGTVRRMAGQLASARLYSETERMPVVNTQLKSVPSSSSYRRPSDLDHVGYAGRSTQKRSHDTTVFDAKKQLHIFMPNLPKKGLLTAIGTYESGCGSSMDDTISNTTLHDRYLLEGKCTEEQYDVVAVKYKKQV
ncbi:unnamed protein product [Ceratitis capitata]|uniref:(Mediterranean fruit fly) hypothetical protein n=1 Tax=Ceratitis capitata TaxID=7213 RepID=A0A811VBU9_CERCA|nr:unnamed protein product [Ceratitis capitata]